jgi:hypothetical protein
MLKIGKFVFTTTSAAYEAGRDKYNDGYEKAEDYYEGKIEKAVKEAVEKLEDKNDEQKATIRSLTKKNKTLQTEVDVLEADRDEAREVIQLKMEVEDKETIVQKQKELLDAREAKLKDRETKLGTEEDKRYKEGYADGVADGVRKVNEITATDRENAMKVAMVAAASHSSPEVVKELANGAKALGSGLTDKED